MHINIFLFLSFQHVSHWINYRKNERASLSLMTLIYHSFFSLFWLGNSAARQNRMIIPVFYSPLRCRRFLSLRSRTENLKHIQFFCLIPSSSSSLAFSRPVRHNNSAASITTQNPWQEQNEAATKSKSWELGQQTSSTKMQSRCKSVHFSCPGSSPKTSRFRLSPATTSSTRMDDYTNQIVADKANSILPQYNALIIDQLYDMDFLFNKKKKRI